MENKTNKEVTHMDHTFNKAYSEIMSVVNKMYSHTYSPDGIVEAIEGLGVKLCDKSISVIKDGYYTLSSESWMLFCDFLLNYDSGDPLLLIKSPIEQIFYVSFLLVSRQFPSNGRDWIEIIPFPQYSVESNGVSYVPDFSFFVVIKTLGKHFGVDEDAYFSSVLVECDGHNFHEKTKQQVSNGNRKLNSLQQSGKTVIRLSGSDIFNNPIQCAYEAYLAILKKFNTDVFNWCIENDIQAAGEENG